MWSNARSEAALEAALPVPVAVRRLKSAKRLRLRFDEASGSLKLTCPWRTNRRVALAWALDQRQWIEAQLANVGLGEPFVPEAIIPIEGVDVRLIWDPAAPRTPAISGSTLSCGGPEAGFGCRIERFLRHRALEIMGREIAEFGAAAGVTAMNVSIGDAASRWGSCSSRGSIRLSWRLILASPRVRRFVVAHEVAHLVHLDHSPRFKALEARLFGTGLAEAKAELRRIGPRLRRIGRG
jgi:predicted metal-dependent hydrolase